MDMQLIVFIILAIVILYLLSAPAFQTKCYLINLDERKDRLKTTMKILNRYKYNNIERFPAVNGRNINTYNFVEAGAIKPIFEKQRRGHHELSYGGVGCFLSHIGVWREMKERNLNEAIVFEDDTLPVIDYYQLQILLKQAPKDWDIIFLGGMYGDNTVVDENFIKLTNQFYLTHAYIINKNKIDFLLKNSLPMDMQIDSWLSKLIKENKINVYALKNYNWMQNPDVNDTDIQTPIVS